jgi:solute carrier family 25 carnitine/acylcarnitine transporter 20/29
MNNEPAWVGFVCGAVSGTTAVVVGHPLDTIKTKLQAQSSRFGARPSTLSVARAVLAAEGLRGLYRGIVPPLLSTGFLRSVQFSVYAQCVALFSKAHPGASMPYEYHFLSGALAGAARAVFESPMELVKVRRQTGVATSVPQMIREEGILGLRHGLGFTMLRNCCLLGSFFVIIHGTKDARKDLPPLVNGFVTGGIAATVAWWLVFPLDVLKSQVQAHQYTSTSPWTKPPSMLAHARHLYATQGIRAFFRGVVPQSFRSILGNGAGMAAYEMTRLLLH